MDGLDGVGKNTVAGILAVLLSASDRVVATRSHPSVNVFGRVTRVALLHRGRLARAVAIAGFGLDALTSTALLPGFRRRHDDVIFIRYLLSAAYLGPFARPVHDLLASFLPGGGLRIFVDARPEIALTRIRRRAEEREVFENVTSMAEVRARIGDLLDESWVVIDNNGSLREARDQLERLLPTIIETGRTERRGREGARASRP